MEQYLQKTYLAGLFNKMGLKILIVTASCAWFIYLWGVRASALIAGVALSAIILLAVRLGNKRKVDKREMQLRRHIGGEMAIAKLLLMPKRQAHFQAALWVGIGYPLRLERSTNEGILCMLDEQKLLIRCIARHESERITCTDLIALQKAVLELKADKGIACVTAELSQEAKRYAETAEPPIKVIEKKELINLAGIAFPATNEQLVALGASKKRKGSVQMWIAHVLSRHRSKRYFYYGAGLMLLYWITKQPYYPVPAVTLMCLSVLSRVYRKHKTVL